MDRKRILSMAAIIVLVLAFLASLSAAQTNPATKPTKKSAQAAISWSTCRRNFSGTLLLFEI